MKMKTINKFLRTTAVLSVSMNAAYAQHSVSISTEVDRIENPLLSNVSPGGVTLVRVAPSYVFETQGDRIRSRFSAGAVLERSSNTALLASRNYPNIGYTWAYSWPTSSLELRATLAESASRNTEFRDLGRVTTDTRERSIVAGAIYEQELAARTRMTLSATNTKVSYDVESLEGYREQVMSSRFAWEVSDTSAYFFVPSYSRLTPAESNAVDSQTRWLFGMQATLAPDFSLTAHAGQARSRALQDSPVSLGLFQLTYLGSRLSPGIEWTKDVAASGFTGSYTETESHGIRLGYRVSEGTTVLARMTRSKSVGVAGARSRGSAFSLSLESQLNSRWISTLAFEDRKSEDDIGNSGKGWSIRAGLAYAFPGR